MDTKQKFVITINRELGSGGRTVGRLLAQKLSVRYYDKAVIEGLMQHFGISEKVVEKEKARPKSWWSSFCDLISSPPAILKEDFPDLLVTTDALFSVESDILREIAGEESCVIAGRSAFFILDDHPNKLSIFIKASMPHRLERVMRKQGLSEEEAKKAIDEVDQRRENYTKRFSGKSRYDVDNYDLVLTMDALSEEDAVEIILDYIEKTSTK